MDHTPHALDYLSVVHRRRWWLILPIVGSILVGAALLMLLPKRYSASVTLAVSAPSVSPNLVNPAVALDNQERVRALTQQLLSEAVLRRVVEQEGLGTGDAARPHIGRIRSSIRVSVPEPVSRGVENRRLDAFVVTYTDSDPARAQRIVNRLADVFVEENTNTRTASAESTTAFLIAERDRSQARLADIEARLRKAKEAFLGRLPEQTGANLQTLAGLRQQLEVSATSLRHQQDRLAMTQRQIDLVEQEAASGVAVSSLGSGRGVTRVSDLERQLASARTMYTERHPEVQRLEAELRTALEESRPQASPAADRKARLQLDPAYRQLLADREATELQIRDLELAMANTRARIAEYEQRVESAPMVEQQLASLQREHNLAQRQYAELVAKVDNALVAESVARNRDGEHFMVMYHAALPTSPVSPVGWRVMLMALVAGLCLGGAAALGREYLDRSVHSTSELHEEFELPVLGEIAHIPVASR